MEATSLKFTRWFTHFLLALTAGGVLGVAWEFKQVIEVRGGLEETQFRSRSRLEEIREKNPFRSIQRSIEKVQTDEAAAKLSRLDKTMGALEKDLGLKRGEEIERVFMELKNRIQDATAQSRPDELVGTLSDKAQRLEGLATSRRWNNLARGAERLNARLTQLKGNGRIESPLVRFMESDVTAMTALIRGSTLEDADKTQVLGLLEGIRQEIEMLLELHKTRRGMMDEMTRTDAAVGRWAARADLAVGSLKHRADQGMKDCLAHLWTLGALLMAGWLGLALAWALAQRAQRSRQDQAMLQLLHDGVLEEKPVWREMLGEARWEEMQNLLRVVGKKQRLGEDFQAAMPFGSVLLDAEGRLIWGNQLFAEQFGLGMEELMAEDVHWDSLAARLSGPESDPVHWALSEMEPGTWQVQLLMEDGATVPLEMHVSPLEHNGNRKALVVFYPLAMMKETIQSQARLIMEPVRLALEALESESWGAETEARLMPLWKQAGLLEDWQKLSRALHRMNEARNTLFNQVRALESEGHDQLKTVRDLSLALEKRAASVKSQLQGLKDMRDSFVSLDQLGSDLALDHEALLGETRAQLKRQEGLHETVRGLAERLQQAKDAVQVLERLKGEYRQGKQEIQESKQRLVQLHNRFLANVELNEKAEAIAAETKDGLIRLDQATSQLESRLAGLDIQITKLAMTYVGIPEVERSMVGVDVLAHERVCREIREAMQEDQELVIGRLKKLVEELRLDAQEINHSRETLAQVALPLSDLTP